MWVMPLATFALMFFVIILLRPKTFADVAPRNRFTVVEDQQPKEILEAAISLGQLPRYRLRAVEESKGRVVLEQPLTLLRWGGVFEVEVLPLEDGQSKITVAVIGHGFQFGGAMRRTRRMFLDALYFAVFAQRSGTSGVRLGDPVA